MKTSLELGINDHYGLRGGNTWHVDPVGSFPTGYLRASLNLIGTQFTIANMPIQLRRLIIAHATAVRKPC